jgi:hypothetical protein
MACLTSLRELQKTSLGLPHCSIFLRKDREIFHMKHWNIPVVYAFGMWINLFICSQSALLEREMLICYIDGSMLGISNTASSNILKITFVNRPLAL